MLSAVSPSRPSVRKILLVAVTVGVILWVGAVRAQFDVGASSPTAGKGPKLDQPITKKMKLGVTVRAQGGTCKGIVATIPFPTDWPEQKVQILEEDFSPSVHNVSYRTIEGGVKQMVVAMPEVRSGEEAHAFVTFEFTRYTQIPPDDTSIYKEVPREKLPKEVWQYLGPSPYIESTHPKIIEFAKQVTEGKSDWEKVEAIYDAVRDKVQYKNGPLKGALKALIEGTGDCEELTSLFIACLPRQRAFRPARVWVPEHCYPEFYLMDSEGNGYWFPCQAAGAAGVRRHRGEPARFCKRGITSRTPIGRVSISLCERVSERLGGQRQRQAPGAIRSADGPVVARTASRFAPAALGPIWRICYKGDSSLDQRQ